MAAHTAEEKISAREEEERLCLKGRRSPAAPEGSTRKRRKDGQDGEEGKEAGLTPAQMLQPELLQVEQLRDALAQRGVRVADSCSKEALVSLFTRIVRPLPQRHYRSNRSGKVLTRLQRGGAPRRRKAAQVAAKPSNGRPRRHSSPKPESATKRKASPTQNESVRTEDTDTKRRRKITWP